MQDADTYLELIRERGRKGLPLARDVYKHLLEQKLYLKAYGKIYRNAGATTHGVSEETVDGMSMEKIATIIEALRFERYRWTPVRRTHIPKKNGKMRPLGVPTWSDKLLQEAIRQILEAYYEPQFSDHSHGFRPGRGCHTALCEIHYTWQGTTWFIEGDISQCFDSFDHQVMGEAMREKIQDGRLLHLLDELLKAGYLEEWKWHETLSGCPQGGIISPILSNIYLDKLDRFVENTLKPAYTRGERRRKNRAYKNLMQRASRVTDPKEAKELRKVAQRLPSLDTQDPDFRRLWYVRYADDFLLGFIGPKEEAEEIKHKIGAFLQEELKLELSKTKTLITHAKDERARFLGYQIGAMHNNTRHDQNGRRSINGKTWLLVPEDVLEEKCRRYSEHAAAKHRAELLNEDVFTIMSTYQAEYRGIVEYYRLAHNLSVLNKLKGRMDHSLVKTLAAKEQTSTRKVREKYRATFEVNGRTYTGMQIVVERKDRKPLVARWGGIPLVRDKRAILKDNPQVYWGGRTELVRRLLADTCEHCGSKEQVEVHHIRALKDLNRYTGREKPEWVKRMAARRRKTLVLCRKCHLDLHAGRPLTRRLVTDTKKTELESRVQ
jgi:group II intron reverse transcriptase/maturase